MKCPHCNSFNKEEAKFCKNCGKPLNNQSLAYHDKFGDSKIENNIPIEESSGSKNTLIICITVVICALIVSGALILVYTHNNDSDDGNFINSTSNNAIADVSNQSTNPQVNPVKTESWQLIGSVSGSGSGLESYTIPEGKIKIKITAFPIKNYGNNYLEVSSSTGDSVSVNWDSKSAVKSKSDSMTFESYGGDTINIDYYETVSWTVDIYKYE